MRTLRPRGGIFNAKKMSGAQDFIPSCNKDTTGLFLYCTYWAKYSTTKIFRQAETAEVVTWMPCYSELCWIHPLLGPTLQI